jgi:hypothetical protein
MAVTVSTNEFFSLLFMQVFGFIASLDRYAALKALNIC